MEAASTAHPTRPRRPELPLCEGLSANRLEQAALLAFKHCGMPTRHTELAVQGLLMRLDGVYRKKKLSRNLVASEAAGECFLVVDFSRGEAGPLLKLITRKRFIERLSRFRPVCDLFLSKFANPSMKECSFIWRQATGEGLRRVQCFEAPLDIVDHKQGIREYGEPPQF